MIVDEDSRSSLLPTPLPSASRTRKFLLISAAITLALYIVPYGQVLARPLLLLSTLAHEMGHGLTALLLGGTFERLQMWASGAGVSEMDLTGFGRIRQGLTLAGGLVGPAVAAAVCFKLGKTGRGARLCLLGVGFFLLAAELLVIRNLFGFVFAGLVAAGCLFAGTRLSPERAQWVVVFLGVQLALSVFSRADYLFTRGVENPSGVFPSDVMRMQTALFLPFWFWGLVCGGFSVMVLIYGVRTCWGR
ncbi:MAG TPA: M50 family metallopeptidase [Thermoanaerobaculia bacterium]|nr:M50 family metallopeptidase [Thermoanaerobaculia bacterium]